MKKISFGRRNIRLKQRIFDDPRALKRNLSFYLVLLSVFFSCQQEDTEEPIIYSDDIYSLKEYQLERCVAVIRNGVGMDFYHEGDASIDLHYFHADSLPAWHPNNCADTGTVVYVQCDGESYIYQYDIMLYNEYWYSKNYNGDYNGSGNPVIFMYTDPDAGTSVKAAMIGQGVDCFNSFCYDNIEDFEDSLSADPFICLADYRTEMHNETVDGTIMLRDTISPVYASLTIGNKFRPNIGGVFSIDDPSDEAQEDIQPVFLIKTREGLYAKFMVVRFKGTGTTTKKLSVQWQAITEEE